MSIAGMKPHAPSTGQPIVEYVDPRGLYIDPAYQRSIGERGLRLIRKIIENFEWSKFKLPTCCYSENHAGETVLFVLDGQHTAIACASHPDIQTIPVQIVEAATVEEQADAFIGLNTERLGVTKLQLHQAAVTAGDSEAVTIDQVCERAGIKLIRSAPGNGKFKPGDTQAVSALGALIDKRGAMKARLILEVLAKAECAPITANQIKAVDLLMSDSEYCEAFDPADLTREIEVSADIAENDAKIFAAAHKVPQWKALAIVWFKKVKKRRGATKAAA
ncbi:hypothetical protein HB777_29445 [Mesorhizobium loti]|nr:hypothetical protein HB777_29445 [Mesorhizobium loti]